MDGTLPAATPNIPLTNLDPPESTPRRSPRSSRKQSRGFPFVETTGDFRLIPDVNRPAPQTPAMDPIDPTRALEPIEARAHRPSNATAGIRFRHATWSGNRTRVLEALTEDDPTPLAWIDFQDDPTRPDLPPRPGPTSRGRRFAACGTRSIVLQNADDPSRYKIGCERCHDRFCLPCMQDRARLIVSNLKAQLAYEPTRFLTLTLKHNTAPLTEQLDRLYASFVALRRRQFWLDLVVGGVAFLELKLSVNDGCWHPHLHVLLRGSYLPQKLVADAWLQITGDSYIVDISFAKSPEHLYSYLTRYVTKGWDAGIYRKIDALREAIQALAGRKLLSSFGSFASLRLLAPPTPETWLQLGTLHEVVTLAVSMIPWAVAARDALFSIHSDPELCVQPPDG